MLFFQRYILVFLCAAATFATSLVAMSVGLGAEDCNDYYFGISSPADFAKALKCYEEQKSWEFLILMHLNGEGTPADVQKADELFKKSEPYSRMMSIETGKLQKDIEERKRHPEKSYPRLDYCTVLAPTTLRASNLCAWIHEQTEEARFTTTLATTRATLTAADARIFDEVVVRFQYYQQAEGWRAGQMRWGTARYQALTSQLNLVRAGFLKLIRETVERRGLEPADDKTYKSADDELNRVYHDDLRRHWDDLDVDEDEIEVIEAQVIEDIEARKKIMKGAQLQWIRYRDWWAELAPSLYKDKAKEFDPAVSIKTAVTKIRVLELRNDPWE